MKTITLTAICCIMFFAANAQAHQKKKTTSANTLVKSVAKQKTNKPVRQANNNTMTYLSASNNYSAKANTNSISPSNQYTITDPTLRALNTRATGGQVSIGKSGIVGMPKRAYGFANGHLTFYATGATSSGTITGTGVVGTGSSLGSIGSYGPAIGLNGKSPYAGSTMWGNATGMQVTRGDSAVRITGKKE